MSKPSPLYRVEFIQGNERYELYAKKLNTDSLLGFIDIAEFEWDTHTSLVVDPSHEKLKNEFADVDRTYIPMHAVLRIDAVRKKGLAKITHIDNKVSQFPTLPYRPRNKD